jgi:hypothetical protein
MVFYALDGAIASWMDVDAQACSWQRGYPGIIAATLDEIIRRAALYRLKRFEVKKPRSVDD